MKFLRKKFVQAICIWFVITGLMCINASIGKLSQYYPNNNISNLLVEETSKDLEDPTPENGPSADGDGVFLAEFDWHLAQPFSFTDFGGASLKKLATRVLLNVDNVHLDRFSPPPEVTGSLA